MTKRSERLFPLIAFVLGFFGVVVCAVGIAAIWSTGCRLTRTNENVFDGVDKSLAAVRDRVHDAQGRVHESKLTTEDIRKGVRNWTRTVTSERLASRLEVEGKAEQVALGLQQADLWLEMSGASIQGVQQVLELGISLGAPVDAALVDFLLEKLASLRSELKQAITTVGGIRDRAADMTEDGLREERIDQVVRLALRVVATLAGIDALLGESADGLSKVQTEAQHLKSKTHRWIAAATIGAVLLVGWMGVGQASLSWHGWKGYQRTRSTA